MKDVFEVLEELYKKVLHGATLENDNQDYILYLDPAISDQDGSTATSSGCFNTLGGGGQHPPAPGDLSSVSAAPVCSRSRACEVLLLQLTVVRLMVTRALALETESHAKETYREIIKILLKSSDFESKLTSMFQNGDKLLAHMATKCLGSLLYFQLKEKITLSNFWIAFCQKNLSEYPESDKVIYCLWTLTVVIKEIFKDTCSQKTDILTQFLAPLDSSFEVLYHSLFSQHSGNLQDTSEKINSLICFLELLELLIASRIHLESDFACQRMLFLKPSHVLNIITWPIPAFVKRKLVTFLKRCLLWKVGEDLCRGPVPALLPPGRLDGDLLALADAVLQAVDLGFLRTLSVQGRPSCFGGGPVQPGCPDPVTLRAGSLLLIRSLEVRCQHCASAKEMKVDLQRFMSELLTFVKPDLRPPVQSHHPCAWLPRVFIEQDDDMLEAAKASLGIYLKLSGACKATESLTQEKEMLNHHSHENGYNPHCIFLFFLKNIGFDSKVLLDFLISSETCFLEYFVRYLKLLHKDWDEFFTLCRYLDVTESNDSLDVRGCISPLGPDRSSSRADSGPLAALGHPRSAQAGVSWAPDAVSEPPTQVVMSPRTPDAPHAHSLSPPQAPQSLVDYDSSEDSDVESTDLCLAESKQTSSQQKVTKKIQDPVGTSEGKKELCPELPLRPAVPKGCPAPPLSAADDVTDTSVCDVGMAYRTVTCFGELQGAIDRLQKKNLFPYNPTALLKLLKQIEATRSTSGNPL
ncbi:protein Lines homolog 1 isoform X1 [Saccopteryx leptura]|uniref:protein Lines homolog 1 isoform X1 n=1 Tax=Saccopteryx leptura TaxID=249018 RepID=UPI00339BA74C